MPRTLIPILFVNLLTVFSLPAVTLSADDAIQFNRDIRPILSNKCFTCHGPDTNQRQAELRLDDRADAIRPRDETAAIVPGQPDKSGLIRRVTSADHDLRMPPEDSGKEPLTEAEIGLLRKWIQSGAAYEKHWAFLKPVRAPQPAVKQTGRVRNAIDAFVLSRLEQKGLAFSAEADRSTLLRRVTFDLTGLPPTPAEVTAFVNDTSPDAYEKVVDRLLASPHYGEQRARYWLDAARYADTNGYQYDLERAQWVWRDWVIHAFNSNLPFDEFTVQQIAGDLLPDATDQTRLATAFHRNHPITIEGGVIDEEYRTEYVVDRVVTTSTVWMGMTMLCSRCHDHKYDPISQTEFYQFFAFFNQVPERGLNGFSPQLKVPSPLAKDQELALDREIEQLQQRFRAQAGDNLDWNAWEQSLREQLPDLWKTIVPEKMVSTSGAELKVQDDQSVLATGKNPATDTYELILNVPAMVSAVRLEALTDPSTVNGGTGRGSNGNYVLSEFEVSVASPEKPDEFEKVAIRSAEADYSQKNFGIEQAIDGHADKQGWAIDGHEKIENRTAWFYFNAPVGDAAGTRLKIRMIHNYGLSHQIARFRLATANGKLAPPSPAIANILNQKPSQRTAEQTRQLQDELLLRFGPPELKQHWQALSSVRAERARLQQNLPATMILTEQPGIRKTHRLNRGEYDQPREEVTTGTPAMLPPLPSDAPRNRLGLAQWLVSPEHPLTARVTVNRFWQQLFGIGLVKTTEDFGIQGEWPSHPQLLDWLSVEFVESDWDVKRLLKTIVMSTTYRQSSVASPELLAHDPENRLLARGPRMRLDAEEIRDATLFSAGLLNEQLGGPSVFPYHPVGLWQEINNRPGYSRVYQQDQGENLYRRSLYTFWKRTVPPPSLATFDAPSREFCVVRRSRTNTPLQAFVLLHDPQFVEAARKLGERMLLEGGSSEETRLEFGFRACLSRSPSPEELAVLQETLHERLQQYRADAKSAMQLLEVGDSESPAELDRAELAAYTTVARLLFNLSEFITRN